MYIIYGTQVALIILFLLATFLFILPQNNTNRKTHRLLFLIFYICLIIIAVTRPETTADTDNYIEGFGKGNASSRLEPMYFLFIKFARLFPFPVLIGFTIYALLSITPRFKFISHQSPNIWASIMVYMSYCYMAQDIIAMRSSVASALLLLVIYFKMQGKTLYLVGTILLATLFHYSALVFFAVLFVNPNKITRWFYIGLLAGSYVLFFIGFDIRNIFPYLSFLTFLDYNLTDYANSTKEVYGTLNGPQILRLSACLLFWIFAGRIKESHPYAMVYLKVFTISLTMFPLFSSIDIMGYRLYEIFASAEAIGLPIMFMGVFRKKVLNRAAIIVYTFYFFYVSINNVAYWDPASF